MVCRPQTFALQDYLGNIILIWWYGKKAGLSFRSNFPTNLNVILENTLFLWESVFPLQHQVV